MGLADSDAVASIPPAPITGSGLRLLAAEALRNLPLLRLAQIEFLLLHVAGRALRGSEADAAEDRQGRVYSCEVTFA